MEKLIELLETFEKEGVEKLKSDVWKNDTISQRVWSENDVKIYEKLRVISKEMGFIKWLFDKSKIDWSKFHKYSFYKKDNKFIQYYDCESLLMALSISDNPIEDLISYLK